MKKFIITITREFGSLGRTIAQGLAEELDVDYYDREIVEKGAKRLNLPVSVISEAEEQLKKCFPLGTQPTATQDLIYQTQRNIILDFAEKRSCILVGRCADAILQNDPDAYHVFIYASKEQRFKNCVDILKMTPSEATKSIELVDKARATYHKTYAGYAQDDKRYKNIFIDSGRHGVAGSVQLLAQAIRTLYAD